MFHAGIVSLSEFRLGIVWFSCGFQLTYCILFVLPSRPGRQEKIKCTVHGTFVCVHNTCFWTQRRDKYKAEQKGRRENATEHWIKRNSLTRTYSQFPIWNIQFSALMITLKRYQTKSQNNFFALLRPPKVTIWDYF